METAKRNMNLYWTYSDTPFLVFLSDMPYKPVPSTGPLFYLTIRNTTGANRFAWEQAEQFLPQF